MTHRILACALLGVVIACGGSDAASEENTLAFHGEVNPLGDYSYDSGLVPPASPVQVQLLFASEAKLAADAKAVVTGSTELASVPGSGRLALDARFLLKGNLHVDFSGLEYDGDLPGLDALDIGFHGQRDFDPFALEQGITLDTQIPETPLPSIPLPASLPGELTLTITAGSVLASTFQGTCAATDGKTATYRGAAVTTGTLAIQPTVVFHLLGLGDKSFPLPVVNVPVPELRAELDLGTLDVAETADAPEGADVIAKQRCGADTPGSSSSSGGASGSSSGASGDGGTSIDLDAGGGDAGAILACATNDFTYDDLLVGSVRAKLAIRGSCTDAELDTFEAAVAADPSGANVVAALHGACRDCIVTEVDTDELPAEAAAIVYFSGSGGVYQPAGWCVGNRTASPECGRAVDAFQQCGEVACGGCGTVDPSTGAADAAHQACLDVAYDAPYVCNDPIRERALADCPADTVDDAVSFCGQLNTLQQIRILCGP